MHLVSIHKLVDEFRPETVVLDPVSSLIRAGIQSDANTMLIRLIDFLKLRGVTGVLTNFTAGGAALERTAVDISSIVDTWLFVRDIELGGERNRAMYVLKSRGMPHSNQLREFRLTSRGVDLLDVYLGPEGVLTGSSRVSQEAREQAAALARQQEAEVRERDLKRKQEALEARIIALRKEFEVEEAEAALLASQEAARERALAQNREAMSRVRNADVNRTSSISQNPRKSRNEKFTKVG